MSEDNKTFYIKLLEDGPYLVYGTPPIDQEIIIPNEDGISWFYRKGIHFVKEPEPDGSIALCRCGASKNKPFCDGSHERIEWDSKETNDRRPYDELAKSYEGPEYILEDNEQYCCHAQFCMAYGEVWNIVEFAKNGKEGDILKHEVSHCPGGRLVLRKKSSGEILEYPFPPSLGIIEQPGLKVSGPIWVKGGIKVISADGKAYEVRNRVALCRCAQSKNKPFCDGAHEECGFNDELPLDGTGKEW